MAPLGRPGQTMLLRRALLAVSRRQPPSHMVLAAARRYASSNQPPPRPAEPPRPDRDGNFQAQMLRSVQGRLARDRAERARYAEEREKLGPGRNWAMTFVVLVAAAASYYMGTKTPRDPDPASTLPLAASRPPKHNLSPDNLQAAWADFVAAVGKENVSTLEDDTSHHATSSWSSHPATPDQRPFCVVYPGSTAETAEVMRVCHRRRIPVVAYSGGTSLEGHYTPTRGGVTVDFRRMNQILAVHERDLDCVVQPAVGWEHLNELLAEKNLFFPPDPGPGAQIGGMVGTGCSGTNAYRYGTMREWVLSLTVVLADGTVVRTRQRPRKSSAGYDLTKLFIGSEGTLGLVTEATLKLAVRPAAESVAVASFRTVREAADCVADVVGKGVPVAAVEILDDAQMAAINHAGSTSREWRELPTLFFKFAGTQGAVREQVAVAREAAKRHGSSGFEFARGEDECHELWSARKEALWATMGVRPDKHVWTGDVAVPISRLPEIVEETQKDVRTCGLYGTIVGHVGDGNFHLILTYDDSERKTAEEVVHRMVKRAVDMEGTVTGEHGVGLVKRDYLTHELGETTVDTMRKLKMALDPLGLLNCDKVVRIEPPKPGEVSEW